MVASPGSLVSALLLLALGPLCDARGVPSPPSAADGAATGDRGSLRIAVVNQVPFHHEVLAGIMEDLRPYRNQTTYHVHSISRKPGHDNGLRDLLVYRDFNGPHEQLHRIPHSSKIPQYDVVIFVSPEYQLSFCREFLHHSRPTTVIAIMHDATKAVSVHDGIINGSRTETNENAVSALEEVHPNVLLAALSPHVVRYIRERLGRPAFWWLPLMSLSADSGISDVGGIISNGDGGEPHPTVDPDGDDAVSISVRSIRGRSSRKSNSGGSSGSSDGSRGKSRSSGSRRKHQGRSRNRSGGSKKGTSNDQCAQQLAGPAGDDGRCEAGSETTETTAPNASSSRTAETATPSDSAAASNNASTTSCRNSHTTFLLQGKLDMRRRNYSQLWSELAQLPAQTPQPSEAISITVLGGKPPVAAGGYQAFLDSIPPELTQDKRVRLEVNRPYCMYYGIVRRSVGLLTLFAGDAYYETKLSSTVITSMVTGTPLLGPRRLLGSYTFLDESSVFLQGDNETTIEAMQRVSAQGPATWAATRASLANVAAAIRRRNARVVSRLLQATADAKAHARAVDVAQASWDDTMQRNGLFIDDLTQALVRE